MSERLPDFLSLRVPVSASLVGVSAQDEDALVILLARTWRVYAVTSDNLRDTPGHHRLRNLFWRLLNCSQLRRDTPISTISSLVSQFSQVTLDLSAFEYPPKFLLRPSAASTVAKRAEELPSLELRPYVQPALTCPRQIVTGTSKNVEAFPPLPIPSSHSTSVTSRPLQSILKRPSISRASTGPVSLATSPEGAASQGAGPTSPRAGLASQPLERQLSNGQHKKRSNVFVASTGRSRIRPVLEKRRSSQGPASQGQDCQPRCPSVLEGPRTQMLEPGGGLQMKARPTFDLPSSWQSEDSEPAQRPDEGVTAQTTLVGSDPLVDSDFRHKFIHSQPRMGSFTDFTQTSRFRKNSSVVRFADEMPSSERGKEQEISPDQSGGPSIEPIQDPDIVTLPRTRSQLSIMIESKRRSNESLEDPHHHGKPTATPQISEKDVALLEMGRKDQIHPNLRLDPKKRPSDRRFRSPSPGPLY